jgi:hypothetical protein
VLGAVLILAASADQAKVVFDYCRSFLESSPVLRQEVESVVQHEIRLRNKISIISRANSFRTTRGRTLVACILDEVSFWRDDSSATPDIETYSAILPSLATVNGLLVSISSAYRRTGLMYAKHRDLFGVDNPDMLFLVGSTKQFNPTLSEAVIDAQRKADPAAARSEWDSEFRADLATFIDDELIEQAIDYGRPLELAPRDGIFYKGYLDPSGGSGGDSYTLCIAHKDGERYVIDLVRGSPPRVSFDPAELTYAYAQLCKEYRITSVVGDFYAANWVRGAWSKTGVSYVPIDIAKSQIYLEVLPLFSRGLISMPEHPKLLRELRLLERRTNKSGKDSVDHGKSGHDDYANSMCGCLRTLSAYIGGQYDLATWQAAFGDEPPKSRELNPNYQKYATPPTWGPDQPLAENLGNGGYRIPSIDEQARMALGLAPWNMRAAFEAAARERERAAHPTPEQIREAFRQAEAEKKNGGTP